jgi:hypothetical protein
MQRVSCQMLQTRWSYPRTQDTARSWGTIQCTRDTYFECFPRIRRSRCLRRWRCRGMCQPLYSASR